MNKSLRQGLLFAGVLVVWELVVRLRLWPDYLLPSPLDVGRTLARNLESGELLLAIGVSLRRTLLGFGLTALAGVMFGVYLARRPKVDEVIGSLVLGMQTLPSICWFPLAILWFGLSEFSILFIVAMGTLFSVVNSTMAGFKSVPPLYERAGRNMGARGKVLLWEVMLPAALPSIVSGMKQGWSFAWRSLMAGELLFVNLGLGHLLSVGRELNDMSQVLGVVLIILIIGVVVEMGVFAPIERKLRVRWGLQKAHPNASTAMAVR
ncbi:MAG: ABC transporter permease [Acidobacteriota bacterium]